MSEKDNPQDFADRMINQAPVYDKIPGVEEHNRNQYEDNVKKKFSETALGRTLRGKNKTGRIIHSVLDVLPIPNVHEVAKAVIKDEELTNDSLTIGNVISETAKRLDWLRTAASVAAALLLVKGADWLGIDVAQVMSVFEKIAELLGA